MESFLHKGEPLAPSTRTMRFIHAKKTSLALSFVVVTTFVLCWGRRSIFLHKFDDL
jgi:hypothetical protein